MPLREGYALREFQDDAKQQMVDRGSLLLALTMGAGKGVRIDDPVLTPIGWRQAGEIRVGDDLVGRDGHPTKVLGVFPQGRQRCYEITFSDRTSVTVDGAHLWYLSTAEQRHKGLVGQVLDTESMFALGPLNRQGNSRWFLPMVESVEFSPQQNLDVDPYILGVLLGDGSLSGGSVSYCCGDEDVPVVVESRLPPEWVQRRVRSADHVDSWTLSGAVPAIRKLGLLGTHSWDKYVPAQYLLASPADRLLLLQGLNDTDGCPSKNSSEFSTTSPQLAKDVIYLTQSLGGTATCSERTTFFTYKGERKQGRKSWRLQVLLPPTMSPFLARSTGTPTKYVPRRAVRAIKRVGMFNTVCFSVAAEDSLFVISNFVVTHNTVTAIATVEDLIDDATITKGSLIVVPGMLKYQWQAEIHKFTERHALVIDGTPKQRALLYTVMHHYWYVIINYEAVVNDWAVVRKLPFECVVADEVSFAKSPHAIRTRRLRRLGKLVDYRYGLTGQPIENRPEDLFNIMRFVDETVLGEFEVFDRTFITRGSNGKPTGHRNLPLLKRRMSDAMVRKTRADLKGQLPDVVEELIPVAFSSAERTLYRTISERLLEKMEEVSGTFGSSFSLEAHYGFGDDSSAAMKAQGEIAAMMLALRQVCDDAELLRESALNYGQRKIEEDGTFSRRGTGSAFAYDLLQDGALDHLPRSTKRAALVSVIKDMLDEDGKVVVFSTFKGAMRRIQADLAQHGSVLFNGDMNAKQKQAAKTQFERDQHTRLFLSSDAGGYGVDLPMANNLISFDLPWSTGKFEQRESRIIRLSSHFSYITLTAMIVRGSIEQRMYDSLHEKKGVAGAYLDGKYDSKGRYAMTVSSLTEFLYNNQP